MADDEKKYVLLGANGMLGQAMQQLLGRRNLSYSLLTRPSFDLTRPETLGTAVLAGTNVVLNCAAYTDVDGAEADVEKADEINGYGVELLANRCKEVGATLVHFSTDYVFAGDLNRPYLTSDSRAPINAYGRSKLIGELAIENSGVDFLLIRTSWVYAPWGKNFVKTMAGLARTKNHLKVVDDQIGRPTQAFALAENTLALLEKNARGTFHLCDGGSCSWFEFAKHIVGAINPDCEVSPCASSEFPRPARRPPYGVLDLHKAEELIGKVTPWPEALDKVLELIG